METYKRQYSVLEVIDNENLLIEDTITKEKFNIPSGTCNKVKKLNNGELIVRYLKAFPQASTDEILKSTGLKNHIYVNKLRKKLISI